MHMKIETDFDNWNFIKKEIDRSGSKNFKHGEVYWCRFGVNIGVEIDGKGPEYLRPIIVLKKFSNECLLAAPITTKSHAGNWYYKIRIQEKDCEVVLIQIKLIDSKRLTQKSICQLSNRKIRKILRRYKILIST